MKLKVLKCHGSGNDFILIDIRKLEHLFSNEMKSVLAKKLCDRRNFIGADGILYVTDSAVADCKMRIFNSDGSEAEMCGNGIRIVGRYISEEKNKSIVEVENLTGLRYRLKKSPNFYDDVIAYEVKLPPAIFHSNQIPITIDEEQINTLSIPELSDTLKFTGLAMPNPHIISFVGNIEIEVLESLGYNANQNKKLFPNGINLSFVELIDDNIIYVATYERGVGITYSCGTGMCASAIASIKNNFNKFNTNIKVLNRGGFINVIVEPDWSCEMTGNATYVFKANIEFDLPSQEKLEVYKGEAFIDEIKAYDSLVDSIQTLREK